MLHFVHIFYVNQLQPIARIPGVHTSFSFARLRNVHAALHKRVLKGGVNWLQVVGDVSHQFFNLWILPIMMLVRLQHLVRR